MPLIELSIVNNVGCFSAGTAFCSIPIFLFLVRVAETIYLEIVPFLVEFRPKMILAGYFSGEGMTSRAHRLKILWASSNDSTQIKVPSKTPDNEEHTTPPFEFSRSK